MMFSPDDVKPSVQVGVHDLTLIGTDSRDHQQKGVSFYSVM